MNECVSIDMPHIINTGLAPATMADSRYTSMWSRLILVGSHRESCADAAYKLPRVRTRVVRVDTYE